MSRRARFHPTGRRSAAVIWSSWLTLTLSLVLRIAHAAERDVDLSAGAVLGVGTKELGATPHAAGAYHHLWTPVAPLAVGFRLSLGASVLPYGRGDGEPVVGNRSEVEPDYLHTAVTLMPGAALALRAHPAAFLSVTAYAGVSFLMSDEMGAFAVFPIRSAGLSTSFPLTDSIAARVSLAGLWLYNGTQLLIPTAGVVWTL